MAGKLLSIDDLTLRRGGRSLLSSFNLSVAAGDFIQIEGDNGAGKTSLLRYMAGLANYSAEAAIQRHHGPLLYLGHKPAIKALLTPRENLQWYCKANNWQVARADEALRSVGLCGYEDVPCQALSAGQLRRVNLARLFLGPVIDSDSSDRSERPPLWLLDEPFTLIDKAGVKALSAHLATHAARGGAVVVTSHQPVAVSYPLRRVLLGAYS